MNCGLIAGITVIACAIAEEGKDNDELALLAAALTQLADTLATIVNQRKLCEGAGADSDVAAPVNRRPGRGKPVTPPKSHAPT